MKKIARRQNEDAQGGDKSKKNVGGKNNSKQRKQDERTGKFTRTTRLFYY
jgi:hypothetical protein